MREVSVPVLVEREDLPSALSILHERNRVAPNHVAFGRIVNGQIVDVTTAEFAKQVRSLAVGLVAAGVGVGDRVAIMSPTCYEWSVANFAIWEAGGVAVPVYHTASVAQVGVFSANVTSVLLSAVDPRSVRCSVKRNPNAKSGVLVGLSPAT